jgi:uncharacterized protein
MRVVIDTNVLWVSVSRRSASHWIFQAILNGTLSLCVTTEILEEYAEIMSAKLGVEATEAILGVLDNLPNIELVTRYFRWYAITHDPDDDKFVDCAVAASADFIVTEDRHFNVLAELVFPKMAALTINQFESVFSQRSQ